MKRVEFCLALIFIGMTYLCLCTGLLIPGHSMQGTDYPGQVGPNVLSKQTPGTHADYTSIRFPRGPGHLAATRLFDSQVTTTSPYASTLSVSPAAPHARRVNSRAVYSLTSIGGISSASVASVASGNTPKLNWGPIIPLPSCPITLSPLQIGFDVCQLTSQACLALYSFVTETIAVYFATNLVLPLVDPADRNSNFLLGTPPAFTFLNPGVEVLYFDVSVPIALAVIAIIIAWGGISMIVRPHIGLSYHSVMEFLPRLLLGAGMAVFGLTNIVSATQPTGWLSGLIEFTNALDQAIPNPVITISNNDWPDLVGHPSAAGIVFATFAAGSTILLLMILWQILVRVAVIDLLIVTAPLAMICWVLPQTQRWTELWTRTFAGMLLVQPIQLLALNVGEYVAIATLFNPVNPTPVSLILQSALQIAILWVVWRLPRLMQQTQAFGGGIISLGNLYFAYRAATRAGGAGIGAVATAVGA